MSNLRSLRAILSAAVLAVLTACCAHAPSGTCPDTSAPPAKKFGATTNAFNNPFGFSTAVFGVDGSSATGAVSGAATYRSDWLDLNQYVGGVSFDVAWSGGSGSPAGTLSLEVSNADTPPGLATAAVALPLANTPSAITGNSGTSGVDAPLTGFRWVRVVATVSAGTFTLTALGYAKRIK